MSKSLSGKPRLTLSVYILTSATNKKKKRFLNSITRMELLIQRIFRILWSDKFCEPVIAEIKLGCKKKMNISFSRFCCLETWKSEAGFTQDRGNVMMGSIFYSWKLAENAWEKLHKESKTVMMVQMNSLRKPQCTQFLPSYRSLHPSPSLLRLTLDKISWYHRSNYLRFHTHGRAAK